MVRHRTDAEVPDDNTDDAPSGTTTPDEPVGHVGGHGLMVEWYERVVTEPVGESDGGVDGRAAPRG
jgi:hypothetical protein